MEIYARQGHTDFVLAAGFKAGLIEAFADTVRDAWSVDVVDTGEDTNTGARVARCAPLMGDAYFVTYADGLGDVDLDALLAFHRAQGAAATLSSVPLTSQYGTIECDGRGRVQRFLEKPRLDDHFINAGFMVFEAAAAGHFSGDDLERHVLPALAHAGELVAYRHHGFWRSMDTYKDALELGALCGDNSPPWLPTGVAASTPTASGAAPHAIAASALAVPAR
jgi:glucose-1-phosphate cytidylyltransferase